MKENQNSQNEKNYNENIAPSARSDFFNANTGREYGAALRELFKGDLNTLVEYKYDNTPIRIIDEDLEVIVDAKIEFNDEVYLNLMITNGTDAAHFILTSNLREFCLATTDRVLIFYKIAQFCVGCSSGRVMTQCSCRTKDCTGIQ